MAKTKDLKECKQAFQSAIAANFDGMWLKDGFAEELVKLYGLESLLYLCALTITNHDSDGRYSRKNKEWAKSIDITENETRAGIKYSSGGSRWHNRYSS